MILKSILCHYSDAYILVNGTITFDRAKRLDERNKGVIFKNRVPSTDCISEMNNTQIDNAGHLDVVMLLYDVIEYRDNYLKISGSLWQYYKDHPNDSMTESKSFKSKIKIIGKTPDAGNTKDVKIAVPLKLKLL